MITTTDLTAKIGRLAVVAGQLGGRTVLKTLHSEGTLKAMRAHYLDASLPGMAFLTIASPGGGVLQGDRLEIDVTVEEGAQLHVGTTSSTRVYAMPREEASAITRFNVTRGAYAEFVPDPFLPYAGSRFTGRARHVVAEGGALLVAEVVGPGRQARGESLAYDYFNSETEVRRPDGTLLFRDTTRLCPASDLSSPGLFGGSSSIGSLFVIAGEMAASTFESTVARCAELGQVAGCSELPNGAGSWFRVLAPDAPSAYDAVKRAWTAARVQILRFGPPVSRRY
jgi:urease accessory protein